MQQMIQTITNWFMTILSLATAVGVFMHDGRVDKMVSGLKDSATYASDGTLAAHALSAHALDTHAHPDFNASSALLRSFAYQTPTVPPRDRNERKHRLSLNLDLGRHAFDDGLMPTV